MALLGFFDQPPHAATGNQIHIGLVAPPRKTLNQDGLPPLAAASYYMGTYFSTLQICPELKNSTSIELSCNNNRMSIAVLQLCYTDKQLVCKLVSHLVYKPLES